MLSASGISLPNELSSVLPKVSNLVRKIDSTFYLYFSLITSCGVQAGGQLLKRVLRGLTLFMSHLSKFLSPVYVGSIFQTVLIFLRYNSCRLRAFLAKFVSFVCLRAIKILKVICLL